MFVRRTFTTHKRLRATEACALCLMSVVFISSALSEFRMPALTGTSDLPENGRIVFEGTGGGDYEIYSTNPDGSGLRKLTKNRFEDYEPSVSPDGERIAFARRRSGLVDIYVMDMDGRHVDRLTNDREIDFAPTWSPDGRRIAFSRKLGQNYEIFTVKATGGGLKRITHTKVDDFYPSYSPDGTKFVWTRSPEKRADDIYMMRVDGTDARSVVKRPAPESQPSFSPDGRSILYTVVAFESLDIFRISVGSGKRTRLTDNHRIDWDPAWSPDGSKVVFSRKATGKDHYEIWVMNADGTEEHRVRKMKGHNDAPSWQPLP